MYLTTIQTYFDRLIFRLIRVPNAIFQPNTKIGTQKVLEQLNRGINAHDVKTGIRLSTIKPLQVKWIVDVFKFMKESNDLIIFGFRKTHISEAAAESDTLMNLCENAFQEIELIVDTAF